MDANAVIDFIRDDRPDPPYVADAREVFLPVPVLGELFVGVYLSRNVEKNLTAVKEYGRRWTVLTPSIETARVYGRVAAKSGRQQPSTQARLNDLWIAALCIQHNLPLLTSDHGFDVIPELEVLHW
ncbi:MAG TPA: PIN domain-containing protein [Thermoanaerobaculia bacterium]|nr:PIN domain-containing protein [Thermoanaerobaculia bacterium]